MEERWKPVIEIAPNCPRCASSNTKFCYYNNYSLSQPRYFCKGCRRYWTKGGSLRNVPFGGGYRRTRRSKSTKIPQRESSLLSTYAEDSIESSPNGDSGSQAGADIDLAAVFANYLNHNPNRVEPDSVVEQTSDEKIERVQINMGNEVGEFGLENFVRDHDHLAVAEDVIWSDPVWEPMSNLQEIEAFSSTNLVNDIWSFFDPSGFEVFSQDLNLDG